MIVWKYCTLLSIEQHELMLQKFQLVVTYHMGVLTNDVIILGGGGLETMTHDDRGRGGGVRLKMKSLFYMIMKIVAKLTSTH